MCKRVSGISDQRISNSHAGLRRGIHQTKRNLRRDSAHSKKRGEDHHRISEHSAQPHLSESAGGGRAGQNLPCGDHPRSRGRFCDRLLQSSLHGFRLQGRSLGRLLGTERNHRFRANPPGSCGNCSRSGKRIQRHRHNNQRRVQNTDRAGLREVQPQICADGSVLHLQRASETGRLRRDNGFRAV